MFNPHIHHHQQHQQQQQFQQHLRQLQQLFQQQPPPPPPPQPPPGHHVSHHHQTQRSIPVPQQAAPPPRMMNLCQATQTTIIAPNPMLQGALLMQQMQGNMRSFGMGGQQFRQFYAAGTRSSLLGPVPMGMTMKPPMRGFPGPRPYHPPTRFYNNNSSSTPAASSASTAASSAPSTSSSSDATTRPTEQKKESDQTAVGTTDDQPTVTESTNEATDKSTPVDGLKQISEELPDEPVAKKQRTEKANGSKDQCVVETITIPDSEEEITAEKCNSNVEHIQSEACVALQEKGSTADGTREEMRADEVQTLLASGGSSKDEPLPAEEALLETDAPLASVENQDEEEEEGDGSNKFYCYLCSITCQNQQNFRNHMNSISHQQRMMEIQHMSNACLVSLLPRVHESLQGANRDGEKKSDSKHWCATCQTHFNSSIALHRRTMEHKLASRTDVSSCAVCKKHFKTPLTFLEHLQSQEHRQKLQEKGSEAFSNLASLDTEGFSLEEEEKREQEADEERTSHEGERQDAWSSLKEVTLNDMTTDEQYDPDTVYGSSFLIPAAGFICELCNKFCHFETSVLHSHCKSQTHFDNFKKYVASKVEADVSSGEPLTEDLTEGQQQQQQQQEEEEEQVEEVKEVEEQAEPSLSSKDVDIPFLGSACNEKEDLCTPQPEDVDSPQTVENPETPAGGSEEVLSAAADAADEAAPNEEEDEEVMEVAAAATTGKKKATGKAKSTRRSGRAANRR